METSSDRSESYQLTQHKVSQLYIQTHTMLFVPDFIFHNIPSGFTHQK